MNTSDIKVPVSRSLLQIRLLRYLWSNTLYSNGEKTGADEPFLFDCIIEMAKSFYQYQPQSVIDSTDDFFLQTSK